MPDVTTIAYKDGMMAADTGVSQGGTRVGFASKIIRVDTGVEAVAVIGWSGDLAGMSVISRSIASGDDIWKGFDFDGLEGEAMVVFESGAVLFLDGKNHVSQMTADFHAIGSGADIAIGAMAAGATAQEAVIIATECDQGTFGPVDVAFIPAKEMAVA